MTAINVGTTALAGSVTLAASGNLSVAANSGTVTLTNSATQLRDINGVQQGTVTLGSGMQLASGVLNPANQVAAVLFGTGADGALTVGNGTTITLSRHMHYTNVTVTGTGKIITNFWDVLCNGTMDLSLAGAGAIQCNGSSASAQTGNTSGGTVVAGPYGPGYGAAIPYAFYTQGANGSKDVSTGNGFAALFSPNSGVFFYGGQGGRGGNSNLVTQITTTGTLGCIGGASTLPTITAAQAIPYGPMFSIQTATTDYNGSVNAVHIPAGGPGGGGASSGTAYSYGGAGGANGGMVRIAAAVLKLGTNPTAGLIQANGGAGGAPSTQQGTSSTLSGAGGGGGGGGGYVHLVMGSLIGSTSNAIQANGGAGAQGASSFALGSNGASSGNGGNGGNGGTIDVYTVNNSVAFLRVTGATGSLGTTGTTNYTPGVGYSAQAGGAGGAGGLAQCNLPAGYMTLTAPNTQYTDASIIQLSGTYAGTTPTGVQYSLDNGSTWTTATTFSASSGSYTVSLNSIPAAGSYQVLTRMANYILFASSAVTLTVTTASISMGGPTASFSTSTGAFSIINMGGSVYTATTLTASNVQVSLDGGATWANPATYTQTGTTYTATLAAPSNSATYTPKIRFQANTSINATASASVTTSNPTITIGSASATLAVVTITGTITSGATYTASQMQVSFNGGSTWTTATSMAVSGTSYTLVVTGPSTGGSYAYTIRSSQNTTVTVNSTSNVTIALPYVTVSTPSAAGAGSAQTISGTVSTSGVSLTNITYSVDGGSAITVPTALITFSGTSWSFPIPAPAAGAHTVTVTITLQYSGSTYTPMATSSSFTNTSSSTPTISTLTPATNQYSSAQNIPFAGTYGNGTPSGITFQGITGASNAATAGTSVTIANGYWQATCPFTLPGSTNIVLKVAGTGSNTAFVNTGTFQVTTVGGGCGCS